MITGKDSIWKMLALFALVLVACLDLIFCTKLTAVMWLNGAVVFALIGMVVYDLFTKWSNKQINDKK